MKQIRYKNYSFWINDDPKTVGSVYCESKETILGQEKCVHNYVFEIPEIKTEFSLLCLLHEQGHVYNGDTNTIQNIRYFVDNLFKLDCELNAWGYAFSCIKKTAHTDLLIEKAYNSFTTYKPTNFSIEEFYRIISDFSILSPKITHFRKIR